MLMDFHVGQKVKWNGKHGQLVSGTVVRVNAQSCTIRADSGSEWRVARSLLVDASASAPPSRIITSPQFHIGDRVEFKGMAGTIIRINTKTYTIHLDDGRQGRVSALSLKASSKPKPSGVLIPAMATAEDEDDTNEWEALVS